MELTASCEPIAGELEHHEQLAARGSKPELRSPLALSRRIPELDGLRGLAIAMVVFFHYVSYAVVARPTGLLGYLYSRTILSWSGVDLFFVLSGFLIGGILLDTRDSPNYFKTFYARRFCRIIPVYLLFVGSVEVAYWIFCRPMRAPFDAFFAGKVPWYAYLSFAQNMWMVKLNASGAMLMTVTWTLAVEEQFYFLLPAVVRFVRRSALPYFFLSGILIAPVVRIFIELRFPDYSTAPYILLPCRMDSLFFGALCAYLLRDPKIWNMLVRRRTWVWIAFAALLSGTLAVNYSPFSFSMQSAGYDWVALLFTTALILAVTNSESFMGKILRWKWLRDFGAIAYSVYLFHLFIYGMCMTLLAGHGWVMQSWKDFGVALIALGITITLAKILWRYVESPFMRWGHTWQY